MRNTQISWTDDTWNPIRGCSRVSEGCRNCYAERVAARFSGPGQPYEGLAHRNGDVIKLGGHPAHDRIAHRGQWTGVVRLVPEHLADPLKWRKPRRIFVNSMSDLFHESLTNEQIAAVFGIMAACPQHIFQVLTKRAKRMREWFSWAAPMGRALLGRIPYPPTPRAMIEDAALSALNGVPGVYGIPRRQDSRWPLPNVELGTSVENQAAADQRVPDLIATEAAVHFVSCEPLIGEVDLDRPRCEDPNHGEAEWGLADDEATPWCNECDAERSYGHWLHLDGGIDWVIAGCESGPGARPCDVAWLRSLRDQCEAAGTAFFLKQATAATEIRPTGHVPATYDALRAGRGSKRKAGGVIELPYLDGVQHAALPVRDL